MIGNHIWEDFCVVLLIVFCAILTVGLALRDNCALSLVIAAELRMQIIIANNQYCCGGLLSQ